ncbi:MAG: hypothetical protein ACR2PL_08160, partial [Dehalococcoidia bacterium]
RQTDSAVISSSSLYHAPAYVASGYHLGQMEGAGAGNAEIQVRLIYVGSGRPIFVEFTRLRVTQIEKYLPGDSSVAGLDQTQINGSPALISWQTQRSHPSNLEVIFVRDRLVVDINAENVDLDVILKMAQSIP